MQKVRKQKPDSWQTIIQKPVSLFYRVRWRQISADFSREKLNVAEKEAAKLYMKQFTEDVCNESIVQFGDFR